MASMNVMPNRIILDAVYDTRTAGRLMGGLHPNQVNRLVKEGVIQGRCRPILGSRRGRTVILGAEIKKFNESLPVKGRDGSTIETKPSPEATNAINEINDKKKRRRKINLAGVKRW
jgi:hypothetical protein